MKGRALSAALAVLMLLGVSGIPAAAEEPEHMRLAQAVLSQEGEAAVRYTFRYPRGGILPGEERIEYLTSDADDHAYTYTYDEAGRLIQSCGRAVGEMTEDNVSGDVYMFRYTYDGQGRLTEESSSHTGTDGAVDSYAALYTYDEAGRIVRRLSGSDGELSYVTEYAYDGAGQLTGTSMCPAQIGCGAGGVPVVTEMSEPVNETRYTYDSQGRMTGTEVDMNGKPATQVEYTYAEAPLLTLQHCSQQDYDERGRALQGPARFFVAQLKDAAGQTVLRFDLQGQPELTFDGAGYLTKAEAGGRTLEFTYESAD